MGPLGCFLSLLLLICALFQNAASVKIDGPSEREVETGQDFNLTCNGFGEMRWTYPGEDSETEFAVTASGGSPQKSVLSVKNPVYLNTGYYSCSDGIMENKVYVFVFDPEHLLVSEESFSILTVAQGENLIVPCRPSSPKINVTLLDADEIESSYDPKFGFTLNNLKVIDSNYMTCSAEYEETEEESMFHVLVTPQVNVIPKPHINESTLQNVQEDDNATLSCTIQIGDGTPFLMKWRHPSAVPESRTKVLPPIKLDSDIHHSVWESTLIINGIQKSDEGLYVCELVIDHETKSEVSTHLNVHLATDSYVYVAMETSSVEVAAGEQARWIGTVTAHPPATVVWLNPQGQDISRLMDLNKYTAERKGNRIYLEIDDVGITDAGNYTLFASNERKNISKIVVLSVLDRPHVHLDADPLYETGVLANVSCRVVGFPTPQIFWSYKRCGDQCGPEPPQLIPRGTGAVQEVQLDNTHVESILQWRMNTPGELHCEGRNELGAGSDSAVLRITDVPEGFRITSPTAEIIVGDNVKLTCAVTTHLYKDPPKWYYAEVTEGSPELVTDSEKVTITHDIGVNSMVSTVVMRKIDKTRNGLYSCKTTTVEEDLPEERWINVTALDMVPAKIVQTNLNGTEVEMVSWKPVVWRCFVDGVPKPRITWFMNGRAIDLKNKTSLELQDNNQTLILKSLTRDDEGEYACFIANRGGQVNATMHLKLAVPEMTRTPLGLIIAVVVGALLLLILLVVLIVKVARDRKRRKELSLAGLLYFKEGAVNAINPDLTLDEQTDLLPYHPKWEFPRNKLKLGKQLGAGAYGVVFRAEAEGISESEPKTTVAVKTIKRNAEPAFIRALASELKIMAHLGRHANVVNLLGACTLQLAKRELLVIVEFCKFGNIHNYLLSNRSRFIDQIDPVTGQIDPAKGRVIGYERNRIHYASLAFTHSVESAQFTGASRDTQSTIVSTPGEESSLIPRINGDYVQSEKQLLSTSVLVAWGFQIARGMEYLASRRVLHSDLAARNVLLAEGNVVKICDFGLARSIYSTPEYVKSGNDPLPVKWMAIESIEDKVFSTQSDVWSFGVVLWELFSLAKTPYPDLNSNAVLSWLLNGNRMSKPDYATQRLHDIMLECWSTDPAKRPTFTDLSCKLGILMEDSVREHYIVLNDQYCSFSPPGEDYLAMFKPPTIDGAAPHYVNIPQTPGYLDMSGSGSEGEGYEMKPMLNKQDSTQDDYLQPRDVAFVPTAVSNPSYQSKPNPSQLYGKIRNSIKKEKVSKEDKVAETPLQQGKDGKTSQTPVKEGITFFESIQKRDSKQKPT